MEQGGSLSICLHVLNTSHPCFWFTSQEDSSDDLNASQVLSPDAPSHSALGSSLARTACPKAAAICPWSPSYTRGNTGAGIQASHITGLGQLPSLGQTHNTYVLNGLCYSNCNEETGELSQPSLNTSHAGLGLPAQHEVGSPVLNKGQPPLSSGLSSQPLPALCAAGRSQTRGGEGRPAPGHCPRPRAPPQGHRCPLS